MTRRWSVFAASVALALGLSLPVSAQSPPPPATTPAAEAAAKPAAPAAPAGFADLPETHWAYASVMNLKEAGIVAGDPLGVFRPEEPVRRNELFKMVLAARKIDPAGACRHVFVDVPCGTWDAPWVEAAYRLAIADGRGGDYFEPQAYVTRQELFAAVVRALGRRWDAANLGWAEINKRLSAFADGGQVADWARPAMAWAVGEGLVTGNEKGELRPKALASRAETAVAVSRILLAGDGLSQVTVGDRTLLVAKEMDMTASMYTTGEPGVGLFTYTGLMVRIGTVAVDPRVIPLGRLLYVEGYGYAVAADIGGAIKGNRIDLYTRDYNEAVYHFGLQPRRVWVLP